MSQDHSMEHPRSFNGTRWFPGAVPGPNSRHEEQKSINEAPIGPPLPSNKQTNKPPQNCERAEACIDNTSLFFL